MKVEDVRVSVAGKSLELRLRFVIGEPYAEFPTSCEQRRKLNHINLTGNRFEHFLVVVREMWDKNCAQALRFLHHDAATVERLHMQFTADVYDNGRWNRQDREVSTIYDSEYDQYTFSFIDPVPIFYGLIYALSNQQPAGIIALQKEHSAVYRDLFPVPGESE